MGAAARQQSLAASRPENASADDAPTEGAGAASAPADGARADPTRFRDVLSRFVTGVTVVTTLSEEDGRAQPWGTTVNAFSSVSLDPPLVLIAIGEERSIRPVLGATRRFAVNILAEGSQELSDCFSGAPSALPRSAFCDAEYRAGRAGMPILEAAIAYLECEVERVLDAGDHTIYVGRVTDLGTNEVGEFPLLYYRRRYLRIERAEESELRGKPEA
jgi:flavin reductase (DIM6/NTAB) family NADH-FMN oxidoreductase RutF